jgi:two-component system NtrC family sensor kinase
MRVLILVTAFFCFFKAKAQNTETDSLKRQLVFTTDDTKRVVILEGLSYAYLSSYLDTALQYAQEGLQLAQKINYKKGESICTNALGNVYFHTGDNAKALQLYLRYLEMKEELNEKGNLAIAYFNIASVYTEEKDYRHALTYLFKAKREDEKAKDSAGILFDLYSLGSIYLRMEKADSALINLNQSHQLATSMDDRNMLGAILNSFGEAYLFKNDAALAEKYYKLSLPYATDVSDNEVITSNFYGLAKLFNKKGVTDSAIHYGRKALLIAEAAPFPKQVLEISTFLTGLFSSRKQYDSAFAYQQLSVATKDSLFNIEQVKKVQNMKFDEQQRQQAMETEKLKYNNKVRLFVVVFASVVFLVVAIVLWRNNKQKQKANTLLQQEKDKVEVTLAELKQMQAQLIQSEKMASLGELTAGIAHEIQNPLNFINNFSDVNSELILEMTHELEADNKGEALSIAGDILENEQKINHHGKRADVIVKSMLQHSRKSTGEKIPTDINALADEYLRLSYQGFRAKDKSFNTTLKTAFDNTVSKVTVIPQDIGRVLLNLYNNAFYAVTSSTQDGTGNMLSHSTPTVWVTTKKEGDKVLISVRDNGPGIPQKVLDKIFQPFYTTKPTGQGTGLGLSLSYDIIKAHKGELTVQTEEGEGAEFIIELPIR